MGLGRTPGAIKATGRPAGAMWRRPRWAAAAAQGRAAGSLAWPLICLASTSPLAQALPASIHTVGKRCKPLGRPNFGMLARTRLAGASLLHSPLLAPAIARAVLSACSSAGAPSRSSATAAAPAPAAAAAGDARWQQRFEGVAPGSVLRIDLPHAAADVTVAVGEHEAIELSGSSGLAAAQAPHDGHPGSSLGACDMQWKLCCC